MGSFSYIYRTCCKRIGCTNWQSFTTQRFRAAQRATSIDYMIEYGHWKPEVKTELSDLKTKMEVLAKPIKDARNKILSHNDLAVLLDEKELGGFDLGEDEAYFLNLREFASLVRKAALGDEEPFYHLEF